MTPKIGHINIGVLAIELPDGRVGLATEDPFRRTEEPTGVILWFASASDYVTGLMSGMRLVDYSCDMEVHNSRDAASRYLLAMARDHGVDDELSQAHSRPVSDPTLTPEHG
ncbi:MAG: hypothetical protein KTR25_09755 [Myxococcales bacterium]|nr:hypothetical protein [Myxococcales bacterium]